MASTSQSQSQGYPMREIAGVSVVDTPLVRAAEAYALRHCDHAVYKHVMRSWLYGVLMIQADKTLSDSVDLEIHAVSALLHDLGWDQAKDSPHVSSDKRFEVDGAIAARDFIKNHEIGKTWEERRVQLVWDSIALHTEFSIAFYKELDVQAVSKGIQMDFLGPVYGVPAEAYAKVGEAFPKDDFKAAFHGKFVWLCDTKPATTYGETTPSYETVQLPFAKYTIDTFLQPWGENHVADYDPIGKRGYDFMLSGLP